MSFTAPPGRCSGVLVASFHTPCRSGSPQGVFGTAGLFAGAFVAFAATVFLAAVAGVWPAAGDSDAAAVASAANAIEIGNRCFIGLLFLAFTWLPACGSVRTAALR